MAKVAIGIDLGGTDIKAGIVEQQHGQIVKRSKTSTNAQEGAEAILLNMFSLAEESISYCKEMNLDIAGIGIGSPGMIDHENGIVVKMIDNLPGWSGMRLGERFQDRFGFRTRIDNDANVCALAECLFGAAMGKSDIVCYTLGTGVGGGIVIGKEIHHGVNGYAGELGHDTVELDGLPCSCGNQGCVEQYASARAIALYARERLKAGATSILTDLAGSVEKVTSKTVHSAALQGDALAKQVIARSARYFGAAIATAICMLDPEMIVVGGGGANMGETLLEPVRQEVSQRVFFYDKIETPVVAAALGEDAGFIGAAGLVL